MCLSHQTDRGKEVRNRRRRTGIHYVRIGMEETKEEDHPEGNTFPMKIDLYNRRIKGIKKSNCIVMREGRKWTNCLVIPAEETRGS